MKSKGITKKAAEQEPETPEQKEIRLLKKRLAQAKKNSALYEKWWREGAAALGEARETIELLRDMEKRATDMFEITKTQWELQQQTIIDLRAERDKWYAQADITDKTDDSVEKMAERIINNFSKKLGVIDALVSKSKKDIEEEDRVNNLQPRALQLICIKADIAGRLDEFSRYTTPGLKLFAGYKYYPINELNGHRFPCDLFHVSQPIKPINTKRPKK